jgi:hypothetical protein
MQALVHDWIDGLSRAEYHFFTLALLLGLLFFAYRIYRSQQSFRFMRDTATSRVASAAQGYVELKGLGELMPGSTITSPFSQRRCLWYQCKVEIKKSTGKRSHWVEESNEISQDLFYLRDETGDCVIIPDGAQVIPAQSNTWYGSSPHARHRTPAGKSGISRFIGFGNYRFTEKLIFVADAIYAIGDFATERKSVDPRTIEQKTEERVKYWKTQPNRFLRKFAQDGDGKITHSEWQQVRDAAKAQIMREHQSPQIHTMRKPREKNHPYIISALPEEQLVRQKRVYFILYLMLFFALFYLFLLMLNHPQ